MSKLDEKHIAKNTSKHDAAPTDVTSKLKWSNDIIPACRSNKKMNSFIAEL